MGHVQPIDILLKFIVPIGLAIFLIVQVLRKIREIRGIETDMTNDNATFSITSIVFYIKNEIFALVIWALKALIETSKLLVGRGVLIAFLLALLFLMGTLSSIGFKKIFNIEPDKEYHTYIDQRAEYPYVELTRKIRWMDYKNSFTQETTLNIFGRYPFYSSSIISIFISFFSLYLFLQY